MTGPVLPASLQAIADIVGAPAALAIAKRFGGTRLYVPAEIDEEHQIAAVIGIDAARELSEVYAGERVEIPKADCWARAARNALIVSARSAGKSQAAIALAHGLTERHVRNIERANPGDDKQGELF